MSDLSFPVLNLQPGDAIKAMMTGSIAQIGSQYLITLSAVNAATGDNIAQEQLQAGKKEEVLSTLGTAVTAMRAKLGEDPNDEAPYSNLSVGYQQLGDYEKGLKYTLDGIRLAPDSQYGYLNAAFSYIALGRFEEARAMAQTALQKTNDAPIFHAELATLSLVQGDTASFAKETQLAAADPADLIGVALLPEAGRTAGHGQLRHAEELLAKAEETSRREGLTESRAQALCKRAQYVALVGGKTHPNVDPAAALALEAGPAISTCVAEAEAMEGNDAAALKIVDDLARKRPQDTWVQSLWVPSVHARIEVNHGNGAKALELLKTAAPYYNAWAELRTLHGQAFLLNKQPQEAEKVLQAVLVMQHDPLQDPNAWLAQLYLARAYAMEGDKAKARTAYQDFLASWKDADPDLPLLTAARAEYAKLQ